MHFWYWLYPVTDAFLYLFIITDIINRLNVELKNTPLSQMLLACLTAFFLLQAVIYSTMGITLC